MRWPDWHASTPPILAVLVGALLCVSCAPGDNGSAWDAVEDPATEFSELLLTLAENQDRERIEKETDAFLDWAGGQDDMGRALKAAGEAAAESPACWPASFRLLELATMQLEKEQLWVDACDAASSASSLANFLGNPVNEIAMSRRALSLAQRRAPESADDYMKELGISFVNAGEADSAFVYLEPLLKGKDVSPSNLDLANALAEAYRRRGDYAASIELHKRVAAVSLADPSLVAWEASAYNNIAGILVDQGDYFQAGDVFRQAAQCWTAVASDYSISYATTMLNLAEIARASGRPRLALAELNRWEEFAQSEGLPIGHDISTWFAICRARCQADLGEVEAALQTLQHAALRELPMVGETRCALLLELMRIANGEGEYGIASDAVLEIESLGTHVTPRQSLDANLLAVEAHLGNADVPAAQDALNRIERDRENLDGFPGVRSHYLLAKSRVLWVSGNREAAFMVANDAFRAALNTVHLVEGSPYSISSFVDRFRDVYEHLMDLSHALGRPYEMLEASQGFSAGALAISAWRPRNYEVSVEQEQRSRLMLRRRSLETTEINPGELEAVLDSLGVLELEATRRQARLGSTDATSVSWQSPPPLDWREEHRRARSKRAVVLSYTIGSHASSVVAYGYGFENPEVYELVSGPHSKDGSRIFSRAELRVLVSALYPTPGMPGSEIDTVPERQQLFHALVPSALTTKLRDAARVLIRPDFGMEAIPWAALIVPASGKRCWLDEFPPTALYFPVAKSAASEKLPGKMSVLSVANPDFGSALAPSGSRQTLGPLPHAERESEYIESVWPGTVERLSGSDATELAARELMRDGFDVWHFGTHGVYRRIGDTIDAYVALAQSEGARLPQADGYLEIHEILGLNAEGRFVVLAACQTGLGDWNAPIGAVTLARSFLSAGAAGVCSALWTVDDRGMSEIVSGMFEGAAKGSDWLDALWEHQRGARKRQGDWGVWAAVMISTSQV